MKIKNLLSAFLAIVMLCGSVAILRPVTNVTVSAAEEDDKPAYEIAYDAAFNQSYDSAQEKIDLDENMVLMTSLFGYQLYCNQYTGEVAYKNVKTGQILTTNPYNLDGISSAGTVKQQLLSQIVIQYSGLDGITKMFYSYEEAAKRGQITVKNIKNGIRVEYTLGDLNATYLLPGSILVEDFEAEILAPMEILRDAIREEMGESSIAYRDINQQYMGMKKTYAKIDPNDPKLNAATVASYQKKYPITAEKDPETGLFYAIYVLDEEATNADKARLESFVKQYTEYTLEDKEEDHAFTMYEEPKKITPLFRLSLEYTLDTNGLNVRLPANGIRFDESYYTLHSISPLPYFGAGNLNNDGYAFYPDGSGAILEFEDLYNDYSKTSVPLSGKVYGDDYAYYTVNSRHQESVRVPVYGVVEKIPTVVNGNETFVTNGFAAILSEGDAMANLTASFGANTHHFASVYPTYYPRPSDSYDLTNTAATGSAQTWTVVSDRKYTGNYTLSITMLTDPAIGDALVDSNMLSSYYPASWIGMANVYQDFLVRNGIISRLTAEELSDDLPLYIESFGSIETTKRFFSIPFTVDAPLTTFEDVMTMYKELKAEGITNINFKLTGFANGGMSYTYPTKLKWMSCLGGKEGFTDLLAFAKQEGFGVYPDFDFTYIRNTAMFDGVGLKKDASRTVDNRYSSKQYYSAVYQDFVTYYDICVSPASIEKYFYKFSDEYKEYDPIGISLSTLGSDLNSDFNEDNPSNREDAKQSVMNVLSSAQYTYKSVMTSGGNAYSFKYVDHILDVSLESSNYKFTSYSVPFMGMVLHGYINFTGGVINEAGNDDFVLLKSIENGASLYYLLSYNVDNITLLKEDEILSEYYSIRYDIWKEELVEQYKELNAAIGDLQSALITDYDRLCAERVLSDAETARLRAELIVAVKAALATRYKTEFEALTALYRYQLNLSLWFEEGIYEEADAAADVIVEQMRVEAESKGESFDASAVKPAILMEQLQAMVTAKASVNSLSEKQVSILTDCVAKYENNEPFENVLGKDPSVRFDTAAILALVEGTYKLALTDAEKAEIVDYINTLQDEENEETVVVSSLSIDYAVFYTDSSAKDEDYVATRYTVDNSVIMVTYTKDDGSTVRFVLNYNSFDVVVKLEGEEPIVLAAYKYQRLD